MFDTNSIIRVCPFENRQNREVGNRIAQDDGVLTSMWILRMLIDLEQHVDLRHAIRTRCKWTNIYVRKTLDFFFFFLVLF